MNFGIRIDDVIDQPKADPLGRPHSVRLNAEQEKLLKDVVERFGEKPTAEILRRGMEAALKLALEAKPLYAAISE